MRNLKKVLSLSLALVMLLGMMVVGAGAAAYTDTVDSEKEEAIEVMSAVKIITGDGTGSFNPDSTLDRAQAAVIIARVLLTPDVVTKLGAVDCQFTDVTPYPWAMAPIQACANAGVIKGYDETTFGPTDKVTGVQFAVMLLRLLGFDDSAYTGATWELTARQDAIKAGLDANGVSITSTPMTREDAAQMAMNALVYSPSGETAYKVGDVTFSNYIDAYIANGGSAAGITVSTAKDSLASTRFNLVSGKTEDAFGREVKTWTVDGKKVYESDTPTSTPVVTYTTKKTETEIEKELKGYKVDVSATSTANLIDINVAGGLDNADILFANSATAAALGAAATKPSTALAGLTGDGKLVEIYANSSKQITKVIVVEYSVNTLKSITEKNGKTTYNFATGGNKTNDDDNTNVILEGAVGEGDVVTIANVGGKYHVYPTTSFTANQTAKKTNATTGTVTVTIGGAQYVVATGVGANAADFVNSKDEATYWVDVNGHLVKVKSDEAPAETQYAAIVAVAANASTATLDNPTGYNVEVRAILADGTIADYTLATALTTSDNQYGPTALAGSLVAGSGDTRILVCAVGDLGNIQVKARENLINASATVVGKVYGYTINSDGKMVLKAVADASGSMTKDTDYNHTLSYTNASTYYKGGTSDTNGGATALFTSKTVFVTFNKDSNGKFSAEAHTGTAGVALPAITSGTDQVKQAVITASGAATGTASVVFVSGEAAAATVDYVYVDVSTESNVLHNDKNVYAYKGIAADGTEVDVYTANANDESKLTKSGVYSYDTDNVVSAGSKLADTDTADGTAVNNSNIYSRLDKAEMSGNLLKIGSGWYNVVDGETEVIYLGDGLDSIAGNKCFVVMQSNGGSAPTDVAVVYVYEAGPVAVTATIPDADKNVSIDGTGTKDITVTCTEAVTITANSAATGVATVAAKDGDDTGKVFTITGVAAGTTKVTLTVTPTDAAKFEATTIEIDVAVKADFDGTYAAVNKTDVSTSDDPIGAVDSILTFTKAATITGDVAASDFSYAVKGTLPAGISGVTFDASGKATVTATEDVSGQTITVTVTPKANTLAAKVYKTTEVTITVTAITGTWS